MTLSDAGRKLLIDFEVGGGEAYYRKFLACPTWPGEQSGITIGIGFDLGYHAAEQVDAAWKNLSEGNLATLKEFVGLKGETARRRLQDLPEARDIEIPWEKALAVFDAVTIPRFMGLLASVFPEAMELPAEARDALLSLVYNRGTSLSGERRIEMLSIRNSLRDGRPQDVPALLRAMCRLWPDAKGLRRRRDAEAALFESAFYKAKTC